METKETLKVYIKFKNGETRCICLQTEKGCRSKGCIRDKVTRDKFEAVQECFRQNRFGK
ncbi:MAG: hypothetical protein MR440_03555 [Firmicutes bacterium]|nr:hypothetical protein [Bacillota bacterium]